MENKWKEVGNINKKMKEKVAIGKVKIDKTAALAPMAGITDINFRELIKKCGASYVETEMISANGLCYGDKKTRKMITISEIERPVGIQLFGSRVEVMTKAAYMLQEEMPDIIDINMGCPMKKVTNNDSGSALLKDPKMIAKIVRSVVKEVDIPVTVKIRSGWDERSVNAVEIAKIVEDSGGSGVIIHGRTREQMYEGKSSLKIIEEVKKGVKIPVIGNGDVIDVRSAKEMYERTGCDLVMIGRGALGNPWIFKKIKEYMEEGKEKEREIMMEEKIMMMRYQIELMLRNKSEEMVMKEMRKHVGWYVKGIKNAAKIRNKVCKIEKLGDLEKIIEEEIKIG